MRERGKSGALILNLADRSGKPAFRWRPDGSILSMNMTLRLLIGASRSDIFQLNVFKNIPDSDLNPIREELSRLTPQNSTIAILYEIPTIKGKMIFRWVSTGVFDEKGNLVEINSWGYDDKEDHKLGA